jgi:hypothetical protein
MFESRSAPDPAAAAVNAITAATREENAAGARRLTAIGELYALRAPDDDVEKQYWVIDGFTGLVVEVAAALGVSRCRARAQVERAVTLRERLPKVAEIYARSLVDAVLVGMIVSRTDLIVDDDAARRVDAELAVKMVRWGRLSKPKWSNGSTRSSAASTNWPCMARGRRRKRATSISGPLDQALRQSAEHSMRRPPPLWTPDSTSWREGCAPMTRAAMTNAAPPPSEYWPRAGGCSASADCDSAPPPAKSLPRGVR